MHIHIGIPKKTIKKASQTQTNQISIFILSQAGTQNFIRAIDNHIQYNHIPTEFIMHFLYFFKCSILSAGKI